MSRGLHHRQPDAVRGTPVARLGYLPWMDGMRAVAVLAVMVFHEMLVQPRLGIQRWTNAGDLGVDVFFAISGFLITSLLLQEAHERGGIRFGAFYLRRARRLLPALGALLLVLAAGAIALQHDGHRIKTLHRIFITATYASNWVSALTNYQLGPLNHTWSLATEEQFYLVWPLLLTVGLLVARRRPRVVVAGLAVLAAAAVAWPMVAVHRGWGSHRLYYGLDTRAAGLALGALVGAAYTYGLLPRSVIVRRAAAAGGAAALVVLIHDAGVVVRLAATVDVDHRYAEAEVFAVASLATVLVIWELAQSAPHAGHRILSWAPLVAVGRISYALYLWDAAIDVGITPSLTGLHDSWLLVAIHVGLTFAAATASWFLVERWFRRRRPGPAPAGSSIPGG